MFSKYEHDVFISHAVEDKLVIANELFKRLEEAGLNIWYSGKDLRIGDSIEAVIRRNLSRSKYAVVIFSQNYLSKDWTMKELYLLLGHEIAQRKVILPILLDVTIDDLKKRDLGMADKFAIPVEKGLDYIVEKIIEEVRGIRPKKNESKRIKSHLGRRAWLAALVLIGLVALSYFVHAVTTVGAAPDESFVEQTIVKRISDQQVSVEKKIRASASQHKAVPSTQKELMDVFSEFDKLKTYYRNEYEFSNGFRESRFRKNVENDLKITLDQLTVHNLYGFGKSDLFLSPRYRDGLVDCITYLLINSDLPTYKITDTKSRQNGDYEVTVQYDNNLRGVSVTLVFPVKDFPKRYQASLIGFLPSETFVFHEHEGTWSWSALE